MKKICLSCKKKFEGKANAKTCSPKCRKRLERTLKRTDSESHKLEQRVGELGRNVLKSFKNKLLEIETLDHELADNQAGFAVIPHVPPTYTNLVVREDASNTPSSSVAQVVQERAAESVPVKVIPVAQAPTEEVKAPKTAKAESARVTSPVATEVTKTVTPTTNTAEPSKAGQSSLTDWSLPEYELESSGLPMAESLEPVEQAATIEPSTPAESKVETPVAQTTETELPTASSLESSTESPQVDRTNSIANFIDNEPKPEGKKKSFLGGAIFKVAGAALALTMLVGGVGLKLANRSTGSNASQQYPNQSASSAVSGLVNGFSSANANEVAELQVNGNGTFTGNIKAANFSGSGSQLVSLNANNISSGSISDARLSANVTLQGNVFNGSSQLVRTDSQGRLPAIDGSQLINIPGSSVDPNTTIQGNIFNGASQLVQLDSSGYLPALNGSLLTNLEASSIASGTLNDSRLSTNVTIQGNTFNGASQLVQLNLSGDLPAVSGINLTNLNASNVSAGTLNDLRLSTNVTIQGNTFNGANQLVQLSPLGFYPSLNGSLITNIAAGNIVTGTLSDSRLSANVALLDSSQSFTGTNTFSNSVVAPGLQSSGAILDVGTAGATLNLLGDLSSNLAVKSGAYTTTIGFSGSPAGDVNYIFDAAATPGTYTICTDIGNCAGSGSGVTTLGGSVNKLAKFSATQAIANSMISDDGTTVTVQPTANSTNSFQIQNLAGTSNLLVADTSNTRIGIGKVPTTGTLDVNGSIYQNGYQVCDSSGNCVGTGGGGSIGGGGTNGTISMFTGTGYTVADSILSQVSATVTATGDLNVTGQYKVNGSQIASTDLADSSDLAKLSGTGPQTFTGNNKFTGTLVAQNSVNSTTAFQIQNAAGSSNLFVADTTNNRIGIGTLPGYTLDVNGDINIAAGSSYRINGVAICGPSAVCAPASGSSNYIQNSVVAQTNANFNIVSVNSGSVVGILRGTSGQTADLLRLQDENGANVVAFANDGALTIGQTSVASGVVKLTNTGGSGTIALSPSNPGSSNYTLTLPAETGTVCTTASLCAGYGAASGSGSYIQNTTSLQSSANFNISGNGTIVGQLRVGDPAAATGTVLFYNTSGSGSITVTPANPGSGSYTLTLPAETGTVCTTGSVCSGYASSAAFIQNGNSFGTTATLGTNDSNNLAFETNNTARLIINNTGEIRTESNDIKLKVNGDAAHGLGYYGTGKTYNSIAVDGPVLYGYSGGILGGSQTYGQPGALRWSNDARVVIGNVANIADAQLQVVSRSVSSGAVTMTASNGATTFTTSSSSTLKAGDYIVPTTSTGQARQVATTAFGTTFTVTKAFSANVTTETYTVYPAVLKVTSTSGSSRLSVQGYTGFVGINTTTPENPLNVNTATTADSAAQTLIATGGTGNKGLVVQGVSSQSANLAEFQTYTGALPLKITSAGAITSMDTGASYYQATLDQGKIQLYALGGSITSSIYQQNNSTLLLSGRNGTTVAGLSGGTAVALTVNNGTSTGNILSLQDNGSDVATIADGGATLFKNSTNSTTAFQIQNAAGTSNAFVVDTTNTRVGIATVPSTYTLRVAGDARFDAIKLQYSKAYVVDAGGKGDFSTISAAYAQAVSDTPSSSNRIAIIVYPGTYSEQLTISTDFISIYGSGKNSTKITNGTAPTINVNAAVTTATIDGLTVENTAGASLSISSGSPTLTNNLFTSTANNNGVDNVDVTGGTPLFAYNTFSHTNTLRRNISASAGTFKYNDIIPGSSTNVISGSDILMEYNTGKFSINGISAGTYKFNNIGDLVSVSGGKFVGNYGCMVNGLTVSGGNFVNNVFEDCVSNQFTVNVTGGSPTFTGGRIRANYSSVSPVKISSATATPSFTNVEIFSSNSYGIQGTVSGGVVTVSSLVTNSPLDTTNLTIKGDYTVTGGSEAAFNLGGSALFKNSTNSTTAFQVQNSSGGNGLTVNTSTLGVTTGGTLSVAGASVTVGTASTTNGALILQNATNAYTLTINAPNQTVGSATVSLPDTAGANDTICLETLANCGSGGSGADTVGVLDGGTPNANAATISGTTIYLQSASASYAGLVNATTQTFAGDKSFNGNVTLAASKSLTVTGGNTASRPASPTEGMVYYDTTTKQLLTYANGKWQADRSTASKIVAASNSSQALKDSADYLATGTSDQTIINTALTAASGGKVYLAEGTYTLSAAVSIPNNTTLAGAGSGTLITLPNSQNGTYKMLTNTDATTGTGVVIRDLRIDGNKSNQSSGAMEGIYFDNMGGGSGSSARTGGVIENVVVKNIYAGNGIYLNASNNNRVANTLTQGNTTWGGIYLVSSSYNTVVGNIAEGNSNYGIILNTNSYGNSLTGNVVQGNTSYGLFIISSSYTAITNNTVIGNGTSGISLSSSTLSTISGNVVQGNSSSGIIIEASTENTVTGNTVQNNASRGINLASAANKNTISGNTLTGNGGSTTNEAIVINASDYNSITSNTINDSACTSNCYAIDISNSTSDKNYLSGNRFSGSSANAATINDVGTNTIYNGQQTNSSTSTNSDVTDFRFRGSANSSTAFAVLNSTGSSIFNVNSSTAGITVSGALASTGGTIDLNASSNNNTNINTGTSTGAVTIGNSAAGAIAIQSASTIAITGTTTVTALSGGSTKALIVNNSTSTGNILEAQDNGTAVFSVADGGAVLAKNSVDSTTAFRVQASSGTSLFIVDTTNSSTIINRATDGTLVDLQVAGVSQGSITVASGTVSYNAFTGSHYGLFSSGSAANAGELVDLTGTNSYRDGSHEPIYGIIRSSTPNSPNILGAYLSTSNPDQAPGSNNPELIMAAGNGDVWVADNGSGNVSIGDPLLSSSVAGYAMRDPGTYAVSHIFAKAAENIDWSQVTTLVSGVKAAKISVLFSYYDRDNTNNQLHAESIEVMNSAIFGGDVSIASSLNVSGATVLSSLTVSGTATLANLKVTGNLEVASIKVNGKIITGGNAPTISAGVGAGTADSLNSIATPVVNVVGNDTSGTITVTVGANTAADELVKLVFASSFSNKPRVVLTPGNRDSAGLGLYYDEANSTKDGLSVLSSNAPETGKTYVFTYLIVE